MGVRSGPSHISQALSELFALRGYAREQGSVQLQEVWNTIAGQNVAQQTRVMGINRGVLQVGVGNASLLGELAGFHRSDLLQQLQQRHPELRLRDLKFRLKSDIDGRGA
jgi:hypothetical protein